MNKVLYFMCLVCATVAAAAAQAAADDPARVHHTLELALDPGEGTLAVTDRMRFSAPLASDGAGLGFTLNAGLEVSVDDPDVGLMLASKSASPAPVRRYVLVPGAFRDALTLRYRGRLAQRPGASGAGAGRAPPSLRAQIGPQGVLLTGAAHWYPRFADEQVTFSLKVHVPAGWTAVSQGELRGESQGTRGVWRWRELQPQEDIVVAANRFEIYAQPGAVAESMVFLLRPDPVIADRYLDATRRYLQLYERMIGPYQYAKFALVENFRETGLGMPSFTLLGSRVLRFPFIIDSSYPHEILHSWWGNAVYVDYARGNWSEGLTAYLADHLVQEQRGRGGEYRRRALEKYRNYVDSEEDFPLNRFRTRHGAISEAVGYNKTLMFFHMLRRQLGDRIFVEGLRRFYAQQLWRVARFADLKSAFEGASGLDLTFVFDQWVQRTGAPELGVVAPRILEAADGYRLRARIEQRQDGPAYRLLVPVVVELEDHGGTLEQELVMSGKTLELDLALPAKPMRFALDPDFDLFRLLDLAESPAALGELFGDPGALLVLPSGAGESVRDGYRDLAERIGATTPIRDDRLSGLPEGRAVWLLGWENRFRNRFEAIMAEQGVGFDGDTAQIGAQTRRRESECIVMVGRSSEPRSRPLGWIGCENRRAIAGLARKLPHYASYGFLSFRGDEPENVLRGRWPPGVSPLMIRLDAAAQSGPLRLAPRASLADTLDVR